MVFYRRVTCVCIFDQYGHHQGKTRLRISHPGLAFTAINTCNSCIALAKWQNLVRGCERMCGRRQKAAAPCVAQMHKTFDNFISHSRALNKPPPRGGERETILHIKASFYTPAHSSLRVSHLSELAALLQRSLSLYSSLCPTPSPDTADGHSRTHTYEHTHTHTQKHSLTHMFSLTRTYTCSFTHSGTHMPTCPFALPLPCVEGVGELNIRTNDYFIAVFSFVPFFYIGFLNSPSEKTTTNAMLIVFLSSYMCSPNKERLPMWETKDYWNVQ